MKQTTMATLLDSFSSDLTAKPTSERAKAIEDAVHALPPDQKAALAKALLPPPDPATNNKIWLIIIQSFAFAMLAAVAVLCSGVFIAPDKDGIKPDMILTIFTTVTAFLAGLFAPSPVAKKTDT